MALLKSTYARRKGTGRKPKHIRIRHRALHTRRHRRFRGIHTQVAGAHERNRARALALVAKRRAERLSAGSSRAVLQRRAARIIALRAASRAVALDRAKKRVVATGQKRKFNGRVYKGRKVPKGLTRKFYGRKPSTKPRVRKIGTKPTPALGAAISPQSYINMF